MIPSISTAPAFYTRARIWKIDRPPSVLVRESCQASSAFLFCTGLHRFETERQMKGRGILIAHGTRLPGNYLKKLAEARKIYPPKPGEVRHVSVLHDERCSLIAGKGPCDCDPDVAILG